MKKQKNRILLLIFFCLLCADASNCHAKNTSLSINKEEIRRTLQKTANWQILNFSYSKEKNLHDSGIDSWVNAVFYMGLFDYSKALDDSCAMKWLYSIGEATQWRVAANFINYPKYSFFHADELCVGQFYLQMYDNCRAEPMIRNIKERADKIMNGSADTLMKYTNKQVWTWSDALFMAPAVYAHLAKITGDETYLKYMDKEFKRTYNSLYDKKNKLFFRDSGYFQKTESNGCQVFWGRGNGWVAAGLVNVLKLLPPESEYRPFYEQLFKEYIPRLAQLQSPAGYWHASLLDPKSYPSPESSATALITYALAYGVNSGLLQRAHFMQYLEKSWTFLNSAVLSDGRLGWVQPIGADPRKVTAEMTASYGIGAFLSAGTELLILNK